MSIEDDVGQGRGDDNEDAVIASQHVAAETALSYRRSEGSESLLGGMCQQRGQMHVDISGSEVDR